MEGETGGVGETPVGSAASDSLGMMLTVDCFSVRAEALHVVKSREVGGSETVEFLFLSGFANRYSNRTRAEPKEVREAVHGPRDTVNTEVGGRCAQSCRRCLCWGEVM